MGKVNKTKQIESPRLFAMVLILLLFSILLVLYSFFANRKVETNVAKVVEVENLEVVINESSLQDYFDNVSVEDGEASQDDAFYQSDPFREVCEGSGAGDNPSISFGTVCLR